MAYIGGVGVYRILCDQIAASGYHGFRTTAWASIASFAGLPATCIPAGRTASGLPTGVQIIGPRWGDLTTIGLAKLLEREQGLGAIVPSALALQRS